MTIDKYLRHIARSSGFAPADQTISSSFYGLNIVGRNAPISVNTENHGYTFFTRPSMNMSYDNLIVDRVLSNLLSEDSASLSRMIRTYLDPWIFEQGVTTPGVDNTSPFIPLLSNNLVSLSGFRDFTLNTTTSQPGLYREEYSYVDDVPYDYASNDLVATFRNLSGDPISFLFLMWGWYMGLVYEGRIMPYPDAVVRNYIDYQTRIYRLVMDQTRTYVTRIGATGAAFPITSPIGNIFNFEGDGSESPFSTANDQITINFRTLGFTYYDNILVHEFNRVGEIFNKDLEDGRRESRFIKLNRFEREPFNYAAYPRINPQTMELEWWVREDVYRQRKEEMYAEANPVRQATKANTGRVYATNLETTPPTATPDETTP